MLYHLKPEKHLRVRHKYFSDATGRAVGYFDDGKIYVKWDNPRNLLDFKVGVWNLVFRVPAKVAP